MNKLRGRSWTELRFRGKQKFAAFSERYGLSSLSKLPTDSDLLRLLSNKHSPHTIEKLLSRFHNQRASNFFPAFDDPFATKKELRRRFANDGQYLVNRADSIVDGRFDLLGFRDLDFGTPIDWQLEPLSGRRSSMVHWSQISEIDPADSGDKKIVWELNRHQYFATLGRAYWQTGDERYAETFAAHLEQWMERNPPKLGINWVSSLEVAFRSISWLWALHFFKDAPSLSSALHTRMLKYLYVHARHLETYLSTYSSPNTHLTGEALGLFYLGTVLSEFHDAARWRETGRTILLDELSRHVLDDGVYFERASYYHRYTADFYTHFLILSERNRVEVPAGVREKLEALLDHLMFITRPDGTTPLIGDDDGGRLAMLDENRPNDFRSLLSTGAVLFNRADHKYVAGETSETTLWLLGHEGLRVFDELDSHPPKSESRAFPVGGFYAMRDGWTSDANYLLFDCGPHGVLGCGHAHADALSFDLAARGRTMLVDPGTYTYTGSREQRDYFRSSAAHNTLTIDKHSSSDPDGPFSWRATATASVMAWKSEARFDFIAGTHDGYERRNPSPAKHTRSVMFLKNDYWVMRDFVRTDGLHHYDLYLHFAAGSHPSLQESNGTVASPVERSNDEAGVQIYSFGVGGKWVMQDSWVSSCYGERAAARVFNFSVSGKGTQEIVSFLIPRRADELPASVSELDALGVRVFEIRDKTSRDLIIVGNGQFVESHRITSDFEWAWARFADDGETLEELVLINGGRFNFDNHELLNSRELIDYVVARRVDDKLIFEIDGEAINVELPVNDVLVGSIPFIGGSVS